MPDGKTHTTASLATAGVLSLSVFFIHPELAGSLSIGAALGAIVSPDLDGNSGVPSGSWISRTFGRPAARLWATIWKPYALLIPHRHWVSHFPVIGTLARVLYILTAKFILQSIGMLIFGIPETVRYIPLSYIFDPPWNILRLEYGVLGLIVSDTGHYLMDIISTWRKRNARI